MTESKNEFAKNKTLILAVAAGLVLTTGALAHDENNSTPPQPALASRQAGMTGIKTRTMLGTLPGTIPPGTIPPGKIPDVQIPELPGMDPAAGRKLFAAKGCVTCHSINGVGGTDATALDARTIATHPFEFVAKMWAAAPFMIAAQEEALGAQIQFTGEELADIVAFAQSEPEQRIFSQADIPPDVMSKMHHSHGAAHGNEEKHDEEPDLAHGQTPHHN